jgi:tetratricopeptide (TPR) repeat protein
MRSDFEHPSPEVFDRMTRGTASPEETRDAVRHLLAACQHCSRLAQAARKMRPAQQQAPSYDYDAVFDRVERKWERRISQGIDRLEVEREVARQLYAELLDQEAVQGLSQVHSTRRYASLALCELLLQTSRDCALEDPARARRATELAVRVSEQLDLELYGAPVVQDLRAIAWAYFADTGRVHADLRLSENALETAELLLEEGTGDPLPQAELLGIKASLSAYSGRFEEAVHLLNKVACLYRRLDERHLLGRTHIKKGTILGNAGELEAALRLIRCGMDLIDPSREPRLMVCATHNYIWFLKEIGRSDLADACLDGARRLYQRAGARRDLVRLRWLEGKIAGRSREAEAALQAARDGLEREGLAYEAALAAMDLSVLYSADGRGAEMRRQTAQMLPLFRSEDMYRETLVALISFQDGRGCKAPAGLLDEVEGYLDRAWHEKNTPSLALPV